MKIAKFFSVIFGILGAAVMVGAIGLCLLSLDAQPKVLEMPQGAAECADSLMEAYQAGDVAAVSKLLYGQPQLGENWEPQDAAGALVREEWKKALDHSFLGECYATDNGICRDVRLTYLEIGSITEAVSRHAHALMTARVAAAETMEELYDESGEFRQELVQEVLDQALTLAMAEGKTVTVDMTLTLVLREGQWWAVPEETLLTALSGGAA